MNKLPHLLHTLYELEYPDTIYDAQDDISTMLPSEIASHYGFNGPELRCVFAHMKEANWSEVKSALAKRLIIELKEQYNVTE